jgi:hypothetical protein
VVLARLPSALRRDTNLLDVNGGSSVAATVRKICHQVQVSLALAQAGMSKPSFDEDIVVWQLPELFNNKKYNFWIEIMGLDQIEL